MCEISCISAARLQQVEFCGYAHASKSVSAKGHLWGLDHGCVPAKWWKASAIVLPRADWKQPCHNTGATAELKHVTEGETIVAGTGSSTDTAQLLLGIGSYVQHETFWVGINCCVSAVDTTEENGALKIRIKAYRKRKLRHKNWSCVLHRACIKALEQCPETPKLAPTPSDI